MIIDHFSFFNEFDMLELRLNELSDIVDVFVLCEATLTFSGKPKPLYFNDYNKERFKDFPIEHIIIDVGKPFETDDFAVADRNERKQRQFGVDEMLNRLKPVDGDIVILTDCDEIPNAKKIKEVFEDEWNVVSLSMPLYYYWMNCLFMKRNRSNTKWAPKPWTPPKLIRPRGKLNWRATRYGMWDIRIKNAGWHFSHLGDILPKIEASAHVEFNMPPFNTQENIDAKVAALEDVYDRNCKYKIIDDLSYLPQYVLDNKERFKEYIYGEHLS